MTPHQQSIETTQPCVLSHPRRTPAAVGLVCDRHMADLRDELANIIDLWEALPSGGEFAPMQGENASESKHTKSPFPPAPVNLTALAIRDPRTQAVGSTPPTWYRNGDRLESNGPDIPDVRAVLEAWCQTIRDYRNTAVNAGGVRAMVDALRRDHLTWIVAQPWVVLFEQEIRACRRALAAAVGDMPGPKKRCDCPYCGEPLWTQYERSQISLRRYGGDPNDAAGRVDLIRCTTGCGRVWDGTIAVHRLAVMATRADRERRQAKADA